MIPKFHKYLVESNLGLPGIHGFNSDPSYLYFKIPGDRSDLMGDFFSLNSGDLVIEIPENFLQKSGDPLEFKIPKNHKWFIKNEDRLYDFLNSIENYPKQETQFRFEYLFDVLDLDRRIVSEKKYKNGDLGYLLNRNYLKIKTNGDLLVPKLIQIFQDFGDGSPVIQIKTGENHLLEVSTEFGKYERILSEISEFRKDPVVLYVYSLLDNLSMPEKDLGSMKSLYTEYENKRKTNPEVKSISYQNLNTISQILKSLIGDSEFNLLRNSQ